MVEAVRRVHLELVGGLAGDMFVAALVDAMPGLRDGLLDALRASGLATPVAVRVEAHRGSSLVGSRFVVEAPDGRGGESSAPGAAQREAHGHEHRHSHSHSHDHGHDRGQGHPHGHAHGHDHHHPHAPSDTYARDGHVAHAEIVRRIEAASLAEPVRTHALGIFAHLAAAEAAVHGTAIDAVEFHEVGAWDSIVDVVSAAYLIDATGPARWSHGAVPLGGGVFRTSHGVMPVPAPATLRLLEGQVVIDDGVPGERVTPTGAAILRYLDDRLPAVLPVRRPERVTASGLGFGTRTLPDRPNAVRCTVFEPVAPAAQPATLREDWVDVIEFEIDDQTGEDLAVGLALLGDRSDVRQVTQAAVFGKKGRMTTRVHVVADGGAAEAVARVCFDQTTTLGLRWQRMQRYVLPRRERDVALADGNVGVKLAQRGGIVTAKAEMDDLARRPASHARREADRRAAEARAVAEAGLGDTTAEPATHRNGAPIDGR